MSWEQKVKSRIHKGSTYTVSGIGKVRVTGSINQFGSRGALFVWCEIVESESLKYPVGSRHELNAEFMY